MLESAGLSRSNPYYIIRQGEVAPLCLPTPPLPTRHLYLSCCQVKKLVSMKNTERLALFQEIAGTRVYDERRRESQRIMTETARRHADIDTAVVDLEV